MSCLPDYESFLTSKAPQVVPTGFQPRELAPHLFGFQRALVEWALRLGRAALFADCGLGKGPMALEWASQVHRHTQGPVLLLAPLAVCAHLEREAERFGVKARYAQGDADTSTAVVLSNYERLDAFDTSQFAGVALDESSILKSYVGKTKRALVQAFASTPMRLCCTATPAPNDTVELGNHAEFLGLMDPGEMLTRWFINDTTSAQTFRLKGHAEAEFWQWVASWAACVTSPADLLDADGRPFDASGYQLPPLRIEQHDVEGAAAVPGEGQLFRDVSLSAATLHQELRLTLPQRAAKAAALVRAEPKESWVLWCNTDEEADALKAVLPDAVEVRGSMSAERKAELLDGFARKAFKQLITKGRIAGYGLNWQHCARHIKLASSFSFEEFYQEVRRSWRFGQKREVVVHVVSARGQERVRETVARKQEEHRHQVARLTAAMREVQLAERERLSAAVGAGHVRTERGEGWELHQGDCVEVTARVAANSVGPCLFSPPFSDLYSYSASLRDMGNCDGDEEFFRHFRYLIPELLRITIPGRLAVLHTKDLQRYRSSSGVTGLRDFPGDCIRAMEAARGPDGSRWVYHSRVTIWTDPVQEMQRTKAHGLLYKNIKKAAENNRQGVAETLVVFRKWTPEGDSPAPVTHTEEEMPLELWQRVASPVWMDIRRTHVLNAQIARGNEDEKHLAPLQLDVVDRCVRLWTNPGDVVFSPFAGVGSEGYGALRAGRRFVGVELKPEYFRQATRYLAGATAQGDLFAGVGT